MDAYEKHYKSQKMLGLRLPDRIIYFVYNIETHCTDLAFCTMGNKYTKKSQVSQVSGTTRNFSLWHTMDSPSVPPAL